MPLVTQLSEGLQPLVFPTDLSINTSTTDKQQQQQKTSTNSNANALANATTDRESSPVSLSAAAAAATDHHRHHHSHRNKSSSTPPIKSERLPSSSSGSSTPLKGLKILTADEDSSVLGNNKKAGKLSQLTEEEATELMLKAAAEKGSSGNFSDNSYSEDNVAVAAAAAAFADANLCNINILSSISAMNSLIGSGNGALSLSSSSAAGGSVGGSLSGGSGGHPCPDCGRVYKLKSSLRNHQKWECGKEPQFQCPFCVYRAKQKMHIGRHMERMHKEKFIKLEDLKSYSAAAGSSGAGNVGSSAGAGGGGPDSSSGLDDVAELRQNFS